MGRPSGLTEPENPAPPSVTAVGAAVSTGVGDPEFGVNVAVTVVSALIVTWQAAVPEHGPAQPVKVDPDVGVAVSVTGVLAMYACEHSEGQEIAPLPSETVPLPDPAGEIVSACVPRANSAIPSVPVTYTLLPSGEMATPGPPSPLPFSFPGTRCPRRCCPGHSCRDGKLRQRTVGITRELRHVRAGAARQNPPARARRRSPRPGSRPDRSRVRSRCPCCRSRSCQPCSSMQSLGGASCVSAPPGPRENSAIGPPSDSEAAYTLLPSGLDRQSDDADDSRRPAAAALRVFGGPEAVVGRSELDEGAVGVAGELGDRAARGKVRRAPRVDVVAIRADHHAGHVRQSGPGVGAVAVAGRLVLDAVRGPVRLAQRPVRRARELGHGLPYLVGDVYVLIVRTDRQVIGQISGRDHRCQRIHRSRFRQCSRAPTAGSGSHRHCA